MCPSKRVVKQIKIVVPIISIHVIKYRHQNSFRMPYAHITADVNIMTFAYYTMNL